MVFQFGNQATQSEHNMTNKTIKLDVQFVTSPCNLGTSEPTWSVDVMLGGIRVCQHRHFGTSERAAIKAATQKLQAACTTWNEDEVEEAPVEEAPVEEAPAPIETITNLLGDTYELFQNGKTFTSVVHFMERKNRSGTMPAEVSTRQHRSLSNAQGSSQRLMFTGCMVGGTSHIADFPEWNKAPV
jgi:hypothetical protein